MKKSMVNVGWKKEKEKLQMEDPVKDVPVIEEDDHAKQSRIIKTLAKHIAKNCETCPMKLYDNFACKQNTRKCVENIIRHAETHLEPSKKGEEG